ncbi:MAG: ABC transporter permease [Oscillospiraceae bacterium]|nr:ABC transporter permease [Oscillospiraceae bacterium]
MTFITNFIYALIRISTPIIYVAICSTFSAQAGLMNMAGESMMLVAALSGVMFSALFHNVWLGILCGMLSSMIIVLIICYATFHMKVDLYLMSISMNMALGGGVVFFVWVVCGNKQNTAGYIESLALGNVDIPLIKDVPILGAIISGHNLFTYFAIIMTVVVWYILYKTKLGLQIRAIGQNPQAAESVGINVERVYTIAFLMAAAIGAFGGMYLSMGYQNFFSKGLTGSRGFVGMAAATIGNNQPFGALIMSFVFGIAYALTNYLMPVIKDNYLMMALPFIMTTVVYLVICAVRTSAEKRQELAKRKALLKMEMESREIHQ